MPTVLVFAGRRPAWPRTCSLQCTVLARGGRARWRRLGGGAGGGVQVRSGRAGAPSRSSGREGGRARRNGRHRCATPGSDAQARGSAVLRACSNTRHSWRGGPDGWRRRRRRRWRWRGCNKLSAAGPLPGGAARRRLRGCGRHGQQCQSVDTATFPTDSSHLLAANELPNTV